MAFRKSSLLAIGGFDPQFRIAGDDVDICWRLQEQGWTVGFSPGAVVWHHRRDSMRGVLASSSTGTARPRRCSSASGPSATTAPATSPGPAASTARRPRSCSAAAGSIYYGTWGTGLFQSVYQRAPGILGSLPLMPEWYLVIAGCWRASSALGASSGRRCCWRCRCWWSPSRAARVKAASRRLHMRPWPQRRALAVTDARACASADRPALPAAAARRAWAGACAAGCRPGGAGGCRGWRYRVPRTSSIWSERWRRRTSVWRGWIEALRADGGVRRLRRRLRALGPPGAGRNARRRCACAWRSRSTAAAVSWCAFAPGRFSRIGAGVMLASWGSPWAQRWTRVGGATLTCRGAHPSDAARTARRRGVCASRSPKRSSTAARARAAVDGRRAAGSCATTDHRDATPARTAVGAATASRYHPPPGRRGATPRSEALRLPGPEVP